MLRRQDFPNPTLGQIHNEPYWVWLHCAHELTCRIGRRWRSRR